MKANANTSSIHIPKKNLVCIYVNVQKLKMHLNSEGRFQSEGSLRIVGSDFSRLIVHEENAVKAIDATFFHKPGNWVLPKTSSLTGFVNFFSTSS